MEGLVRDIVRLVQSMRKNAGFAVEDRIEISWDFDGHILEALGKFDTYFRAETLTEIIKSYSDASKNLMPEILSQTFNFMKENQEKFLKSFNSNFDVNSNNEKSTETLKNWQDFQSQMMSNIMYPWYDNSNTEDSSETKKSEKAPKEEPKQENYKSDIDLMKEQIATLQKQLNEKNKE